MKKIQLIIVLFLFTLVNTAIAQKNTPPAAENQKQNVQKVKPESADKVKTLSNHVRLTENEQKQIKDVMNRMQIQKDKIKKAGFDKKTEEKKIKVVKENQKKQIKKILGKERYNKYKELKKKDII